MNKIHSKTARELLCGKLFPLLLLAVMACTYAIQIPQLGFYLDDWVSIAAWDQGGEAGLLAFGINDSRPFAAWVTAKFFAVLGTGVLRWQLITLFWRYLAGLVTFALLSAVWPEQKPAAGFTALLFSVFPYFRHQAICIAYFMILMQYFVILLSFLLTVKALQCQSRRGKAALFLLSYLTGLFHLACIEYYLSLEAARALLIYFVLRKRDGSGFGKTLKKTAGVYIPYALILVLFAVYRFVYIPSLSPDVREIGIFGKYPGISLPLHFAGLFLQYLTESLLGVWYRSISPADIDLLTRNNQLALGLGILAAAVVFLILHRNHGGEEDRESGLYEMILTGVIAMFLGFLPGMALDISPASASNYHDRYLIPSFWGIALFSVSLVWLTFRKPVFRNALLAVMVCTAVFFQIRNAYQYRYSWKYQQQFAWQMKWRVPDLEENTAVIGDGVIAPFMGGWADSSLLLEMYGRKNGIDPTPFWFFTIGEDNYLTGLYTGEPLYIRSKMYEFQTDPENVLLVTKPEYGRCFWVVDEADIDNPFMEPGTAPYLPYQNKARIITEKSRPLPAEIFGSDYTHDWCYYFQKADLAFDRQEYDEALRLYDEAEATGAIGGNPTEMRPFIKSAAFAGDWEKALGWTEMANSIYPERTTDYFENLWRILARDLPDSAGKAEALARVREILTPEK